ncbi:hypothetical protein BGZ72_008204 [Mortierella alpina]|nr:hypothetical protein BGZ72_008204 [Mortierella alpina]
MAIKKKVQFKNDDVDLVSVSLNDTDSMPHLKEDMDAGRDYKANNSKISSTFDKNQVDPEPADSNSMEPSLSSISAPVAQPPPLHCNTSPHRHSSAPMAMSDATLTNSTHLSSTTTATTSNNTTTTPSLSSSSSASVDSALSPSTFPKNATTTVEFVLESPDLHAIEMQHFGDRSDQPPPTVLEHHQHVSPPAEIHSEQPPPSQSNFFTGWFTIPPSLAGRPRLTQQQEEYVKREFERGPVPLMWPKEAADLENQSHDWRNDTTTTVRNMGNGQEPASSVGNGWFRSWGLGSLSKTAETRTEGAIAQ